MYTAEDIRNMQDKLNGAIMKQVENITNTIYEMVKKDPSQTQLIYQHSFDKQVVDELVKLGYGVDQYLGGAYADAWWTKITWNK